MSDMKIAMIGQKGIPAIYGGVEKHVHDLSIRVVEAGHDVTAYSRSWYTGKKENYTYNGVNVLHTKTLKTKHLDTITHTLTATLHAIFAGYDVIHYHGVGPSLLSWIPRIFSPKTKVITTFHSIDRYHAKWNWLAKFILRLGERTACMFAHDTITVSRSLQQYCVNEYGSTTAYIPNAVEPQIESTQSKHIKEFGLTKDNYLVMVSRLVKHKGAHLLVQAFTELKAEHQNNQTIQNLKLAIVGGSAYTNSYVKSLHKLASSTNDIVFTDFQSGKALDQLYAHAKALVHPSMNEGLPITVLQAMSHSTPVLVSNIPEHLEIVKDVRMIFDENEVEAIKKAILNFLNMPESEIAKNISMHDRIIASHYSWDVIVPQVLDLYQEPTNTQTNVIEQLA